MVRHSHQAIKPEKFTPMMRATPVRLPIEASAPIVLNSKRLPRPPLSAATIFSATIFPWRNACCAVGGQALPVAASGTAAQSPSAHTPGNSATSRNSFVTSRPHSLEQFNVDSSGFGETPAVQTSRLVLSVEPSPRSHYSLEILLTES